MAHSIWFLLLPNSIAEGLIGGGVGSPAAAGGSSSGSLEAGALLCALVPLAQKNSVSIHIYIYIYIYIYMYIYHIL
jgi:hypothetical protein